MFTMDDTVIGIGSPHGDDQIGWAAIDHLRDLNTAKLLTISDPIDMLNHLSGVKRLLLIDGCRSRQPVGSVVRVAWSDADERNRPQWQSSHRISVVETLRLAKVLNRLPTEVIIYGIEIAECEPQSDMCEIVKSALPSLVATIRDDLLSHFATSKSIPKTESSE